jgi:hypothetical protein
MIRACVVLLGLAACDQVFNLHRPPDDASAADDASDAADASDARTELCTFGPPGATQPIAPGKGLALVAGRFDDGDSIDLVLSKSDSNALALYRNNSGTLAATAEPIDVGGPVATMIAADVDQDGVADIAFAGAGFAGAALQKPSGWEQHEVPMANSTPTSIAVANLDGTGLADLVVAQPSANQLQLVLGTANHTLGSAVQRPSKHPTGVLAADLDGDTSVDLITAIADENGVVVYVDTGANFSAGPLIATGMSPVALALGTLGVRPVPDLVVVNEGSDTVRILRNSGGGTFTSDSNLTVKDTPVAIALGDINLDGFADILVVNSKSRSFSLFRGTATSFEVRQDFETVDKPLALALADFSGDGYPDLAVLGEDAGFVIHTQVCAPP